MKSRNQELNPKTIWNLYCSSWSDVATYYEVTDLAPQTPAEFENFLANMEGKGRSALGPVVTKSRELLEFYFATQ